MFLDSRECAGCLYTNVNCACTTVNAARHNTNTSCNNNLDATTLTPTVCGRACDVVSVVCHYLIHVEIHRVQSILCIIQCAQCIEYVQPHLRRTRICFKDGCNKWDKDGRTLPRVTCHALTIRCIIPVSRVVIRVSSEFCL
jgi:hypothetical protein